MIFENLFFAQKVSIYLAGITEKNCSTSVLRGNLGISKHPESFTF